jgi:hypothetical protein
MYARFTTRLIGAVAAGALLTTVLVAGEASTAPASAAAASTTLVESFDGGASPWIVALGKPTATASTDKTEGSGALKMGYDLSAGTAELGRTATPTSIANRVYSSMSIDYKGDGTYNTLYLRLRDATGEVFFYRVANLNTTTWKTAVVDLKKAPAAVTGGNGNGVLDGSISVFRLVVGRNTAEAKTSGSVTLDNLRLTADGWTLPSAVTRYFPVGSAGTGIQFEAGTTGDYRLVLTDLLGHTRTLGGASTAGQAISLSWNGKDDAGASFSGSVSAVLKYDTTADGALATSFVAAGSPYFAGVTAVAKNTATGSIAGVNSSMTTYDSAVRADAEAILMESASLRYSREEFDWNRIEPRKGFFEWPKFDQAVEIASARNLEIIGKLVYSADWASSAPAGTAEKDIAFYPPKKISDYTDYVTKVVSRYKDTVKVWEVWNEPNEDQYWRPASSAAAYGAMLKATYAAIKAVDPTATVLTAGFAGFSDSYMAGVVAAGAANSYDGLAIHTFTAGAVESGSVETWIQGAKNFNARNNPDATLWITELGWSTCASCPTKVNEEQQAQYLTRAYLDAAASGVRGIAWYNLRELGTSTSSIDNFGLVTTDGTRKPAYTALSRVAYTMNSTTSGGVLTPTTDGTKLVSDMATFTGWKSSAIGGASKTFTATTTKHSGSGSFKLDYNFAPTGSGVALSSTKALTGTPTALSLWVYGDNSNTPVYLKFVDATGEAFEAKIGNVGGKDWERMTFYFDAGNPNYTTKGGDADGTIDYPISFDSIHLYRSTSGVTKGSIYIDDLTAHYGSITRGTMLMGRNFNIQAAYNMTAASSIAIPVAGVNAYLEDRGSYQTLVRTSGKATFTISPMPRFVVSTMKASPESGPAKMPTTITWQGGDRARMTVQITASNGSLVRTLSAKAPYESGTRTVTWDGKTSSGAWAPAGVYKFRVQTFGADGRTSTITRSFTLT